MRYSARREHALATDMATGLNWLDIADSYKACRDWSLVAQANAMTLKDLEAAFQSWPQRPPRAVSLKVWASMLEAAAAIDRCKLQTLRANSGGRAEGAYLRDLQQQAADLTAYVPKCCPAAAFFMQGATLAEAEKIIGKIKCTHIDECREKCLTLAHTLVRQSILQAATDGSVRAQMYYGDAILHLGAEGNTTFTPTRLVFVPEALDTIAEEEAKDEERRAKQG